MVALNTLARPTNRLDEASESFLAHLTEAAYGVALKHGIKGSFVDLELDLWRELRRVVAPAPDRIVQSETWVG